MVILTSTTFEIDRLILKNRVTDLEIGMNNIPIIIVNVVKVRIRKLQFLQKYFYNRIELVMDL